MYRINGLTFAYEGPGSSGRTPGETMVLDGIDLSIGKGELICLAGPSGSGKSTLLNLLGLIEPPQGGALFFKDRDVGRLDEAQRNQIRRHEIGFVFQDFQLIEVLTVEENVEYFVARQKVAAAERRRIVAQCLEDVGLADLGHRRPNELSGGQRQRVAIARALAKRPAVIIADEPTASLDAKTGRNVMQALRGVNERHGVTIILASHDPMVLDFVGRVVRLSEGRVDAGSRQVKHAG